MLGPEEKERERTAWGKGVRRTQGHTPAQPQRAVLPGTNHIASLILSFHMPERQIISALTKATFLLRTEINGCKAPSPALRLAREGCSGYENVGPQQTDQKRTSTAKPRAQQPLHLAPSAYVCLLGESSLSPPQRSPKLSALEGWFRKVSEVVPREGGVGWGVGGRQGRSVIALAS